MATAGCGGEAKPAAAATKAECGLRVTETGGGWPDAGAHVQTVP